MINGRLMFPVLNVTAAFVSETLFLTQIQSIKYKTFGNIVSKTTSRHS